MSNYMVFLGNCTTMNEVDYDRVVYCSSLEQVVSNINIKRAYNAVVFKQQEDGLYDYFCDSYYFNLVGENV